MKTVTGANDGSVASGMAPTATGTVAPEPVAPEPVAPPGAPEPETAAGPGPETAAVPEPETTAGPKAETAAAPEPDPPPAVDQVEDTPPFWVPWHPNWPAVPARGPRHPGPRRPAFGIFALLVLGLVATFFAWVSAEPIWLAAGHGDRGTATATQCSTTRGRYQCATFTAAGGRFVAEDVTLLGTQHGRLPPGSRVPAEMVSRDSTRAYAVDAEGLRLRSAAGLAALLLCGLGIAWGTGATRLAPRKTRRWAVLACVGAPLLLALAFLATTW